MDIHVDKLGHVKCSIPAPQLNKKKEQQQHKLASIRHITQMNQPNIPGKARLTISIPATQPNPSSTRSRIKNVIPGKILTGYCNSLLTSGVIRRLSKMI
jgi:hypothetical protein